MQRIPSLNADITIEILIRLPAKPLARFRCACKLWHSLASDPHLLRVQSARTNRAPIAGFFLCDNNFHTEHSSLSHSPGLSNPSLSFLPGSSNGITICSSCNGLILCKLANSLHNIVCNPTTMEYFEIPAHDGVRQTFLGLAFDPAKSPYFKVVSISKPLYIYSSETHSWRRATAESSFYKLGGLYQYRSVFWNGLLVWAGCTDSLVTFDVERDCMGTLPIPPLPRSSRLRCSYLRESLGKLHMIGSSKHGDQMAQFDVFEMKPDSHFEWTILYHVDLETIQDVFPETNVQERLSLSLRHPIFVTRFRLAFSPLCVVRGGEGGEEDLLLSSIPGKVIAYKLEQRMFKEVCSVLAPPYGAGYSVSEYRWYRFHSYSHTLAPLLL